MIVLEAVIDYSSHHRYSYSECVHFPFAIVLQRLVGPRCETSPTGNPADKGIAGRLHTGDVTNDMPRAPDLGHESSRHKKSLGHEPLHTTQLIVSQSCTPFLTAEYNKTWHRLQHTNKIMFLSLKHSTILVGLSSMTHYNRFSIVFIFYLN
jgi:hypothetical protein